VGFRPHDAAKAEVATRAVAERDDHVGAYLVVEAA
jgi:hypothetical protein